MSWLVKKVLLRWERYILVMVIMDHLRDVFTKKVARRVLKKIFQSWIIFWSVMSFIGDEMSCRIYCFADK